MHISSNLLLIMALGNLQFSDVDSARSNKCSFLKMTDERKSITTEQLLRFADSYSRKLNRDAEVKTATGELKIDFPTIKNKDDWHEYFKMKDDGSFICKKSRLRNLMEEVYQLQRFYSIETIKAALVEALAS